MHSSTETFLDHVKWLRRAAQAARAELIFAGDTMQALLRQRERHAVLHPQFLTPLDGAIRRTPQLHDESEAFLGWLPYRTKHWPIAVDRLAFNHYATEAKLPVPQVSPDPQPSFTDVVIRRVLPSFEPYLAGPFRSAAERPLDSAVGEYYERYVEGEALTVWFWDGRPICAESAPAPFVVGDGVSALGDLVVRSAGLGGRASAHDLRAHLAECDALARYRGHTLSKVLPSGEKLVVGMGHGSPLVGSRGRRVVDLTTNQAWNLFPLMLQAGAVLFAAIPEKDRAATLFAVNMTVDGEGKVWLHDMDASPRVHPLTYAPMLSSVLDTERRQEETGVQQ